MIEYTAFFGSIQIFNFLKNKGAELKPSLWQYAIHGKNPELIHLLEDNHVKPTVTEEDSYIECFKKSIKCHHNEIADYFFINYLQREYENSSETVSQFLEYYNFAFLHKEHINETSFCHLCHYDYYSLLNDLLTSGDIDININTIQNHFFQ